MTLRAASPTAAVVVLRAQALLVELADTGLRDLVDDRPVLRQLPLGDLVGQELSQRIRRRVRASRSTTATSGRSSHLGSGTPMTAASMTSGCPMTAFSRSTDEIHSPPDLMMSLVRSVSVR